MKRLIIMTLIALNVTCIPITAGAASARIKVAYSSVDGYKGDSEVIINQLKKTISEIKPTGNPDIDYLNLAEYIHVSIIALSKIVQKYGENPEMIKVATDVIEEYQGQGKEMQILLHQLDKNNKSNPKDSEYFKEYKAITDKMLDELSKVEATENIELNYLTQIDILDKSLVDLSKLSNDKLKNDLAKKIANTEIKLGDAQIQRITKLIEGIIKE